MIEALLFFRKYPWAIYTQMLACGYDYGNHSKYEIEFAKGCVRRKFGLGHHAFKISIKADAKVLKSYNRV
jgi:hypothetical protein